MVLKSRQVPFYFEPKADFGYDDFMVAKCNQDAVRLIELWPDWPFFAFSIYGPKGCGKSHLAHIFAEFVALKFEKPIKIKIVNAVDIKPEKVAYIHAQNPVLVVENMTPKANNEALFHLFNIYQNHGGYILFTSEAPLTRLAFKLPDLKSRLALVPTVAILEPDEPMLRALLVKLFNDRQIIVSADVLNYILHNAERSFSYIEALVEKIDLISLTYKQAVTINIVKEAIADLNKHVQQELF